MYVCICMHIYEYIGLTLRWRQTWTGRPIGLYTLLLLPIVYGLWHTKGRSRGRRILPNSRAKVLQQCGQCRRAGRKKDD